MTVATANQPLRPLDDAEMAALRASIAEHGQQVPIVRQAATGQLIDGHHRLAVCVELGLEPRFEDLVCNDAMAEALRLDLNTARRQMSPAELGALQTRLIRDVYPTTPAQGRGRKGKALAVAREVGERVAKQTGLPAKTVTPSAAQVVAAARVDRLVHASEQPKRPIASAECVNPSDKIATDPTPSIERGTDLLDATKAQLLARMCELAGGTELQLGQAIVERAIVRLNNPVAVKAWVETKLSRAMGRQITVGAIRGAG